MYIYENHMGGLYSSEWQLDYDDLYCEQCGDSDWEIGNFETPEELWNLIKPYDLCCIGCKKADECEAACDLIEDENAYYSYDLLYCMEFLAETFDFEEMRYIYLICRDKQTKRLFVKFQPLDYKFGKYHQLPNSFSLNKELDDKIALSLIPITSEVVKKPKKVKTIKVNDITYVVYECVVNKDEDDQIDGAYYYDDNWYGWLNSKDYNYLPQEEFLEGLL